MSWSLYMFVNKALFYKRLLNNNSSLNHVSFNQNQINNNEIIITPKQNKNNFKKIFVNSISTRVENKTEIIENFKTMKSNLIKN